MRITTSSILSAALAGTLALMAGCQSQPPMGDTGGVIDARERTRLDARSPEADVTTLLAFSDKVAQGLADRILTEPRIAEANASGKRVVLEFGGLNNRTTTPRSDFEAIQRRVFIGLVNNNQLRQRFLVVESGATMDAEADRLSGSRSPDLLDESRGTARTPTRRYDPEFVYVIRGNFDEIKRGGNIQSNYIFDMTVTHLASREIVFAEQFEFKQLR